jgi:hypothetical protein
MFLSNAFSLCETGSFTSVQNPSTQTLFICLFIFHLYSSIIAHLFLCIYEGVSKIFLSLKRNKQTTTISTPWEATQRVMATKLTRLTHKISIQMHLVTESCTICSSRSRRPVRKLLDTPSFIFWRLGLPVLFFYLFI